MQEVMSDMSEIYSCGPNEDPLAENILENLRHGKISEAIVLISQVGSKYQRSSLVNEAWKVARAKSNIAAMKQLLTVKLEKYQFQELFKQTIEALFAMEAESDAVYLVTFTKFPDEHQDYGWYVLSNMLLSSNEYEKVEHIYGHLTTQYYQSEIAERFLLLASVSNEPQRWMIWFARFQQHASKFGSSKYLDTAKRMLANQSEVDVVTTLIGKNFSSAIEEQLFKCSSSNLI